jgi:hypothetical protein
MLGVAAWGAAMPALTFFALSVGVLVLVAVWEWRSFHGGWRRARAIPPRSRRI